jgi:hypothetical protein
MSSYDWETDSYTYNVPAMDPTQIWRSAVALAATKARQALPECSTRIDKAIELVLNNAVELLDGGKARVTSQHNGTTAYVVCNGTCECHDAAKAPARWCKHRLARALTLKAIEIAKTRGQTESPITLGPNDLAGDLDASAGQVREVELPAALVLPPMASEASDPAPLIPQQFLVMIQGKPFIQFQGLLHLAHQQGLLALSEEATHVTDTYVMAQARAEFHDGRVFRGVGDSSPDNVGAKVKPHWRRLAGTRAMARCLRNALNISMVAVEELD